MLFLFCKYFASACCPSCGRGASHYATLQTLLSSTLGFFTAFTAEICSCRRYHPIHQFWTRVEVDAGQVCLVSCSFLGEALPINCQLIYIITTTHNALAWYLVPTSDSLLPTPQHRSPKNGSFLVGAGEGMLKFTS
jgi:hypothetical protein